MLTFGSLFSGIGGIDLGLERAGMECRWQVECDDFCIRVLERHWPDVPRYRDVRTVTGLEPVDLIAGGFPCQDISVAGKGAGIEGDSSGLWREFARLVGEMRPRCVLVENVPALRTRGADRVLGDLETLGYSCWPCVVGARHVGAPHRRDRVWIVAHREGKRRKDEGDRRNSGSGLGCDGKDGPARLADASSAGLEGLRSRARGAGAELPMPAGVPWPARPGEPQHDWEEPRVVYAVRGRYRGAESPLPAGGNGAVDASTRTTQSGLGRPANGVSRRLALKALGNAVVPQVAEVIGRAIMRLAAQ